MKLKIRGSVDVMKKGSEDELEYRFKLIQDVTPQPSDRPKNKRVFFWAMYDAADNLMRQSEKRYKKLEQAINNLRVCMTGA